MFPLCKFWSISIVSVLVFLAVGQSGTVQAQDPQAVLQPRAVRIKAQQPHHESFTSVAAEAAEAQKKNTKLKKTPQKKGPQVWEGDEDLAGYGALTFRLWAGGKAVMIDAKETMEGTWSKEGNTVTLTFGGGNIVYTGTINGQTFSGTARDLRHRWNFTVMRK
jgi:hypothetical protein